MSRKAKIGFVVFSLPRWPVLVLVLDRDGRAGHAHPTKPRATPMFQVCADGNCDQAIMRRIDEEKVKTLFMLCIRT